MSLLSEYKLLLLTCTALLLTACCRESELPDAKRKLYSSNPHDRNEAALTVASCGSPKGDFAVPRLIQLLYDENVGVQSSAAYALRKIDTPAARRALERPSKK